MLRKRARRFGLGVARSRWQWRYFEIAGHYLRYYKSEADAQRAASSLLLGNNSGASSSNAAGGGGHASANGKDPNGSAVLGVIDLAQLQVVRFSASPGGGDFDDAGVDPDTGVALDTLIELQTGASRNTVIRASSASEAYEWEQALHSAQLPYVDRVEFQGGRAQGVPSSNDAKDGGLREAEFNPDAYVAATESPLPRAAITKRGSGARFRASVFSPSVTPPPYRTSAPGTQGSGAAHMPSSASPGAASRVTPLSLRGPLQKKSKLGMWQTRYFEVAGHYLKYYKVCSVPCTLYSYCVDLRQFVPPAFYLHCTYFVAL